MQAYGETATFRRPDGSLSSADVLCRSAGYGAAEYGGGIIQGDRKLIALAEDFEAANWPAPQRGDIVMIGGKQVSVEAVDSDTRKIAGVIIAYEIQARG
jgi:hypothetical protein